MKRKGAKINGQTYTQDSGPAIYTISQDSHTNPAFIADDDDSCSNSSGIASCEDAEVGKTSKQTQIDSQTAKEKDKSTSGNETGVQLKKSINLLHCTAIMIAVTGHSSVFISSSAILKTTGSIGTSLIVWLVGGLINLMLALCFAELGTMLPHAGGPYAYVMRVFGPLPGFLIMWGYVVLIAGPFWAFLAYTASLYIIKPIFPDCEAPDGAVKLLAGWIMITLVVLNCVYMKRDRNFENAFEGTNEEPGQIAVSIFYAVFSYGGWQVMTSLMEEVKRPGTDLPRSVYITFTVVILKYVMTNVAYYTILTPSEVINSQAVALLFMQRLYSPIVPLISVFVAMTSIGALNASIMGHSR
ncbi:hypothetical protein ScPMuIL_000061 [Solemya velum]